MIITHWKDSLLRATTQDGLTKNTLSWKKLPNVSYDSYLSKLLYCKYVDTS